MSEAIAVELEDTRASKNDPPEAPGRVAELRVSAHLMTLDAGLYCVFPTQGTPDPDPATGLPGVRVTPAPGIAGRPEAVSVSTFREDGWLNGTAALVRVSDGRAEILISVYQDMRQGPAAAPQLQVLRLSREPNGASSVHEVGTDRATQRASSPADANPEIMAHVQRRGDVAGKIGDWVGIRGSRHWVEGFGLEPSDGLSPREIEYQGVLGRDWLSPWVEGGKYCGSRGMALPLLGLRVRLKGEAAKTFECSYSATFVDGSEIGPVPEGKTCETETLAPLEALQIVIRPREKAADSGRAAHAKTNPGTKPSMATKIKPLAKPAAKRIVKPFGRR